MTLSYDEMMALFAETRAQIAASSEKIEQVSQQIAASNRNIDRLTKRVESISDTLGKFAEESIEPAIIGLFREKGILLREVSRHIVQHAKNGFDFLYEIDLLAVNGEFAVVTEVKSTLRKDDVDEHLERIAKIQLDPVAALQGKTIYAAIGAMIASDEVCRYAAKKGLFVIVQSGENVRIDNEADFVGKTWWIPARR
jgi:uncharacterized coiled-coil protein SlyX